MLNRFAVNDRAQWYSARALGTVAAVVNGGMAYVFHADSGAKFTVRADELAPVGSPDRVAPRMPAGESRVVFYFQHPQSGAPKQRTPAQQQQANAAHASADSLSIEIAVCRVPLTDGSLSYDVRVDNGSGSPIILCAIDKAHANKLAALLAVAINENTVDSARVRV